MSLFAAVCALLAVADFAGKPVHLFDGNNAKTTVLIFVRTDCPISNRYAPEIQRLYKEYSPRAAFYLVYPDPTETAEAVHKHMTEYGYVFDALRDPGQELVKLSRARVTPEAAVFSSRGELLYHGRIDDLYVDFGKSRREPTQHDLEDAIREALAGKPVKPSSTRAIGCFLADVPADVK